MTDGSGPRGVDTDPHGTDTSGTDPRGTDTGGDDPRGAVPVTVGPVTGPRPAAEATRRGNVYLLPSATAANPESAGPGAVEAEQQDPAPERRSNDAGSPDEPDGDHPAEREDWAWVQEWRAGGEPTPWATGVALAVFSALVVGVAVWVLSAGLSDRPIVAIAVNLLVAAGLAPAIWLSRGLPVLRWVAAGAASGIAIGWVSALLMLPMAP